MVSETELPFSDVIPPELEADTNAVMQKLMTGNPLNAESYSRIRERADRIRTEVFRKHGLLDIGVPSIRELRDSE